MSLSFNRYLIRPFLLVWFCPFGVSCLMSGNTYSWALFWLYKGSSTGQHKASPAISITLHRACSAFQNRLITSYTLRSLYRIFICQKRHCISGLFTLFFMTSYSVYKSMNRRSSCLPPKLISISSGSLLNLSASNNVISNHFCTFVMPIIYLMRKTPRECGRGHCPWSRTLVAFCVNKWLASILTGRGFFIPPEGIVNHSTDIIQIELVLFFQPSARTVWMNPTAFV